MYRARIKTKDGFNEYIVENLKELQEEFDKPNEGVYVNNMSQMTKEELIEERNKLLWHVTGMSYNTQKALELTKEIRRCDEKEL